jgi:ferrous-iron efflux pump FieF
MQADVRMNVSASLFSVAVALLLVAAKLWAFGQTGALSVAASLADSAIDLMMALTGLAAILYAAKPADEDHAFGHTSAEDLAALGQALFLIASAGVIAVTAARRLLADQPVHLTAESGGIAVMVGSALITVALIAYQRRVSRSTGSRVIAADMLHYVADLIPNLGAILALIASAQLDMPQIDSVVAVGAAAVLATGAFGIGKGAWDALMDRSAEPEMIEGIAAIARDWPGLHGFHDLKTRTAGSRVFVNMHIELDGAQSLEDAHAIGAALRRAILQAYPQADVIIHKDPVGVVRHPDDKRLH